MITIRADAREETLEQRDYKQLSDDELTVLAVGETSAETELIVRLTPEIYSIAMGINPLICEDLLQEGLLGAVNAAKSFDPEKGRARTFLMTAARNRMLSALKCNSIISGVDDPEQELSKLADDTPNGSEELETLRQAIKTCLTDYEREVISLYLVGLSYSQIGQRLGKEPKSVDNAMQRARKKLRTELEKH